MSKFFSSSLSDDKEYLVVYHKDTEEVQVWDPRNILYSDYQEWVEGDNFSVEKVAKGEIGKRMLENEPESEDRNKEEIEFLEYQSVYICDKREEGKGQCPIDGKIESQELSNVAGNYKRVHLHLNTGFEVILQGKIIEDPTKEPE